MAKKSSSSKIILSVLLMLFVFAFGAFGTMSIQRMCANQAKIVKNSEIKLKKLKRENDFWNAQIAISRDPATLRRRAADKFKLPENKNVVFAYLPEDGNSARKQILAFRAHAKIAKNLKTAKR